MRQDRQIKMSRFSVKETPETRLGKRVKVVGECWIVGRADRYAVLGNDGIGLTKAHRFAYETFNDVTLTSDDYIHHTCFNKGCINPKHLERMTCAEHSALHLALRRAG